MSALKRVLAVRTASVKPHGHNAGGGWLVAPAEAVALPKSRWRYSAFKLQCGAIAYSMPPPAVQPTSRDDVTAKAPTVPVNGPPPVVIPTSLSVLFCLVNATPPVA